jgi:hypothetical protein
MPLDIERTMEKTKVLRLFHVPDLFLCFPLVDPIPVPNPHSGPLFLSVVDPGRQQRLFAATVSCGCWLCTCLLLSLQLAWTAACLLWRE